MVGDDFRVLSTMPPFFSAEFQMLQQFKHCVAEVGMFILVFIVCV